MNEPKICKYKGCNEPVNSPHDDERCVFHAQKKNKGISDEKFNKRIYKKIKKVSEFNKDKTALNSKEYNFKGYIFPGNIYIDTALLMNESNKIFEFTGIVIFTKAEFKGNVEFSNVRFKCIVLSDGLKCSGTIQFDKVVYLKEADFTSSIFSKLVVFNNCIFAKKTKLKFCLFKDDVHFLDNEVRDNLIFDSIKFEDNGEFRFLKSRFNIDNYKNIQISFKNVIFNPFVAKFENIKIVNNDKSNNTSLPVLIFRYCQLKDVYFVNNDMSLFSFYKSSFDEARFISSTWDSEKDRIFCFPFDRRNVIAEERFLKQIDELEKDPDHVIRLRENYKIEDLNSPLDIAALYRQMKTALDSTKDFEQAGWFYFNELEMKRKKLEEDIENNNSWFTGNIKKIFSKYILYFLYKVFTGYGQKPMWSTGWFAFFLLLVFTPLNYLIGVKPVVNDCELNPTIWDSFVFSLYRILPTNYIPFARDFSVPNNIWGLIIPFFNTLILIILIIFIGIGLKRHFRRF